MKNRKTYVRRMLCFAICLIMAFTSLPTAIAAVETDGYTGEIENTISDPDTSESHSSILGSDASTEFLGKVWADKSVYTSDAVFKVADGKTSTVKLNEEKNGEDFLIAYSALSTTSSVLGSTRSPVDVVLILDISGSMSNENSNMDNGKSRIYNTVQAANSTVEYLMNLNSNTRVAVVAFSNTAEVLLPLDRYTKRTETKEVWISTGNRPGEGYSKEATTVLPYFSLNRETGSKTDPTFLYTNAVNSSKTEITKNTKVSGGTNIQMGLYEGMKILASEKTTTANVGGKNVKRVPSVILLSDGSPTYSSNSSSWWHPENNNSDGPGRVVPYAGNGMKAILVGSYMKDAIERNYKTGTSVYTIGIGISDLPESEKNLAYMTLNPKTYWDNKDFTNDIKTEIKEYWEKYTADGNTGCLDINVGEYVQIRDHWVYNDKYYYLTHPTTGFDVDPKSGYDYVDCYYGANDALSVTNVFDSIVSNIAISMPQVPTEIKGDNPIKDGYITYTDPIGNYMEIKDVKAIIYGSATFTYKNAVKNGNVTTYTFSGDVDSVVYGKQSIKDIIITVEETDGKQTLTVKIPASVIPLRVNEVSLNTDGSVKSHTNNGALPVRIIYSVGLRSEIIKTASDGSVYIDREKLSANYLKTNSNADGSVNFYSNVFTDKTATIDFEPSKTNGAYFFLEDTPLYTDKTFTAIATDTGSECYYKHEYYYGSNVKISAEKYNGENVKTNYDGVYIPSGTPKNTEINNVKAENKTQTAQTYLRKTKDKVTLFLGNNGKLSAVTGGNLQIKKTVTATAGLTAPELSFEFSVSLGCNGSFDYDVKNSESNIVSRGKITKTANKIYLKDGQAATVYGLPPETSYTVTEKSEPGFSTVAKNNSGKISAGKTSIADFTNNYSVKPITWPANGGISGTKELVGRDWDEKDVFTFLLSPYKNEPLPERSEVTVTAPQNTESAAFDFGKITFSAPGTYRYSVSEKVGALPGISYSKAVYEICVTVADNKDGTLSVSNSEITKLTDDSCKTVNEKSEIKFVNTYSANSVDFALSATKNYTDNSGKNPLRSGMFEFSIEPIGIVKNGVLTGGTESVPMPKRNTVTNSGPNVIFPTITFCQSDISGNSTTFRYKIKEVIPESAKTGMVYDRNEYTVDVTVAIDPTKNALQVSTDNDPIVFRNVYTPLPVKTDMAGVKTFIGRDMKEGESFEFLLKTNANTVGTATLSGLKDGIPSKFLFKDIEFSEAGTYVFEISEKKGLLPAVDYDDSTHTVTVDVDDMDNDGKLDIVSADCKNAVFVNRYTSKFFGEPITLSGTKILTGKKLSDGEFFFNVDMYYNGDKVGEKLVSNSENGDVIFLKDEKYEKAGIYEYYITEQIPETPVGEITYDSNEYKFTVVVADDGLGNLKVTEKTLTSKNGNVSEIVFENIYTAPEKPTEPPKTSDGIINVLFVIGIISVGAIIILSVKKKD